MLRHLLAKASLSLVLLTTSLLAHATPLDDAKAWLDGLPRQDGKITPWDYAQNCTLNGSGSDKWGCKLKEHPGAGLVICKDSSCNKGAEAQLKVLASIQESGIGVIPFIAQIYSFPCQGKQSKTCSGYLLQWFDGSDGQFYKPTGSGEVAFVKKVKDLGLTSKPLQERTCTDFKAIAAQWPTKGIGDFQGVLVFATGQFLVADPTRFAKNIPGLPAVKRVCSAICPSKC